MPVAIKFTPEGNVDEIHAEHPYELLYCAYMMGRFPPASTKKEIDGRLKKWGDWLNLEVDDGEDDGDGGAEAKGDGT